MSTTQVAQAKGEQVANGVVVLASADRGLRQRLRDELLQLRWTVIEAGGGAEAMAIIDVERPEAFLVDRWLPDLEVEEFAGQMGVVYTQMDVLRMDGTAVLTTGVRKSGRRHELLYAIRGAQGDKTEPPAPRVARLGSNLKSNEEENVLSARCLPEMIGESKTMLELTRMIRLVAPKSATVLIEGETGTGKEVVAKAVHRLSMRSAKPFVVLNCAAIPESLLEAELFGHARGAFTGAVQSRVGRIETADGGTLFLDEIGEMPLVLQAKMLRFLECGELQRVGDNEVTRVDVRIIAATHQPLERRAEERAFRLDLYHRLAVFPVEVPALRERMDDLPLLVRFFLGEMGRREPMKSLTSAAMDLLRAHAWPGNVRELMHVLERAAILAGDSNEIGENEIRIRRAKRV